MLDDLGAVITSIAVAIKVMLSTLVDDTAFNTAGALTQIELIAMYAVIMQETPCARPTS